MEKHRIQLTPKQVLEYIILGINNGNYEAAKDLAKDAIEQIDLHEEKKREEAKNGFRFYCSG